MTIMLAPIRQPCPIISVIAPLSPTTGEYVPTELVYPLDGIEPPLSVLALNPRVGVQYSACRDPSTMYFSTLNDITVEPVPTA